MAIIEGISRRALLRGFGALAGAAAFGRGLTGCKIPVFGERSPGDRASNVNFNAKITRVEGHVIYYELQKINFNRAFEWKNAIPEKEVFSQLETWGINGLQVTNAALSLQDTIIEAASRHIGQNVSFQLSLEETITKGTIATISFIDWPK